MTLVLQNRGRALRVSSNVSATRNASTSVRNVTDSLTVQMAAMKLNVVIDAILVPPNALMGKSLCNFSE